MTPANTHTTSPGMVRYPRIARIVITLCAGCTRVTLCRSRTSAHTGAPKRAINIGQKTRKCRRSLQQLQKKTSQGCKVAPETPPSVRPSRTSPKYFMLLVTSILMPPMIIWALDGGPFPTWKYKGLDLFRATSKPSHRMRPREPIGEHPAGVSASVVETKTYRAPFGKMGRTASRHHVSRHHKSISHDHQNTCCRWGQRQERGIDASQIRVSVHCAPACSVFCRR